MKLVEHYVSDDEVDLGWILPMMWYTKGQQMRSCFVYSNFVFLFCPLIKKHKKYL